MKLRILPYELTVCKVSDPTALELDKSFYFIARTDEELSLVCPTEDAPAETAAREDGWRGFRIEGVLDFSLIGILSELSGLLAGRGIGIFAVSTYDTDYILVKREDLAPAVRALEEAGHTVVERKIR